MQYSQSLAMIVDFIESAMNRDFKIDGAVAQEAEIDNAVAVRFGFAGDDNFDNRSHLEFFCNAVERAAATVNQNEEDGAVISFDREEGALFSRDSAYFVALLEVLSVQQNLNWVGAEQTPQTPLTSAFRKQAEQTLRNQPDVLLRLENNFNGYSNRDDLYRALLREGSPGLYTLGDLRGALRAEAIVEGRARSGPAPTFWYH